MYSVLHSKDIIGKKCVAEQHRERLFPIIHRLFESISSERAFPSLIHAHSTDQWSLHEFTHYDTHMCLLVLTVRSDKYIHNPYVSVQRSHTHILTYERSFVSVAIVIWLFVAYVSPHLLHGLCTTALSPCVIRF